MKKVAVMQPYIFPYIGYFQLVNAVDDFVFYDDVNFIKRGWINRNNILINNEAKLLSFPCIGVSQNKEIREIEINLEDKQYNKNLKSISLAYKQAPYFEDILPLVESVFTKNHKTISNLTIDSIITIADYLNLKTNFHLASQSFEDTKELERADRLISITKNLNGSEYINAIGGKTLYQKDYFYEQGVNLKFLQPKMIAYKQFEGDFISSLSMIDVLMFNSIDQVKFLLNQYLIN